MRRHVEHQVFLQVGQFGQGAFEFLRPQNRAAFGFDQLRGDPQQIARAPDVAFHHIAHPQIARHRVQIGQRAAAIACGRAAGDHPQVHALRQRVDDVLDHPDREHIVIAQPRTVGKWQHRQRRRIAVLAVMRRSIQRDGRGQRPVLRGGAHELAHVGDKVLPGAVVILAVPVRQVGGLSQLEHDRAFARLDHRWYQRLVAIGQRRFGPDPARSGRAR